MCSPSRWCSAEEIFRMRRTPKRPTYDPARDAEDLNCDLIDCPFNTADQFSTVASNRNRSSEHLVVVGTINSSCRDIKFHKLWCCSSGRTLALKRLAIPHKLGCSGDCRSQSRCEGPAAPIRGGGFGFGRDFEMSTLPWHQVIHDTASKGRASDSHAPDNLREQGTLSKNAVRRDTDQESRQF